MKKQYPGYIINLEGGEGCGKTSQVPLLVKNLRGLGLVVYPTREPGGTSIGEQIREILHSKKNVEMHLRTETLLYQAARVQIIEQEIKPRLLEGEVIVMDRYFDSTIAYQGFGRQQNLEQVQSLIDYATGGLTPDLTVLLDVDMEVGIKRRKGTEEWNRMDALGMDFHKRVHEGYKRMVAIEPKRWIVIDANQNFEEVAQDLQREVVNRLASEGVVEGLRRRIER